MDDLLERASNALGAELTDPVELGGSDRSAVARCRSSVGGSVVVKRYPDTSSGAECFTAEAAGLAFTAGSSVGPELLAADPGARLIVMSDLGDAPSLADVLLGTSAGAAEAALLAWARSCGELALLAVGGRHELAALRQRFGQSQADGLPNGSGQRDTHWLERRIWEIPDLLSELSADLGVEPPAGLTDDLAAVASLLKPGTYEVFSPGDICPDNNLFTDGGVRFIDYENAEFHSAFLDAAYLRMPFSTCWCVFRLPGDLAARAESVYRELVAGAFPDLASDDVWLPGVRRAMAAWTLHAMTYLLDTSIGSDSPMIDDGRRAPTRRQLLRYRWRELRADLKPAGELGAISELMSSLLAATQAWNVPDLPVYPAFR